MNTKPALFLDIDGTVWDGKNKCIPTSTLEVIKKIYHNVDIFIATGRSRFVLKNIELLFPYMKGFVLMNGEHVIYDTEELYVGKMPEDAVINLIKKVAKENLVLGLLEANKGYMSSVNPDYAWMARSLEKEELINLDSKPFDLTKKYTMGWLYATNEVIDKFAEAIPELTFYKWGNFGCDVVKKGCSKVEGIKKIIARGGYDINQIYVAGDGENDLEMFEYASVSIAMGNAVTKLKEKATIVTKSVENDGLALALNKIFEDK